MINQILKLIATLFVFTLIVVATNGATFTIPQDVTMEGGAAIIFHDNNSRDLFHYGQNDFATLEADIISIESLAIRLDEAAGEPLAWPFEMEVRAGVTTVVPGEVGFPDRYDRIISPSAQVVIPRMTFELKSSNRPGPAINPFEIVFEFENPFVYDRRSGHLVIDFHTYSGRSILIDTAHLNRSQTYHGGLNDNVFFGQNAAPVTLFRYTPIPEPAVVAVLLLGASCFYLRRDK